MAGDPNDDARPITNSSRRRLLKQSTALAFGTTLLGSTRGSAQQEFRFFEFKNNGVDKVATVCMQAPGEITLERGEGHVDPPYAQGYVNPKTGPLEFRCREDPVGFDVAGPANVYYDGSSLVEPSLPRVDGTITANDINTALREDNSIPDSEPAYGTITFTNPSQMTAYEMVSQPNTIYPTNTTQKDVGGLPSVGEVQSHIGPDSGTDTYQLTADLFWITVAGDCDVLINGEPIRTPSWWT